MRASLVPLPSSGPDGDDDERAQAAAAAAGEDEELTQEEREAEQLRRDAAHVVPSPLRPDLVMQRQFFKGTEYYIVKDPLALSYFRLKPEEAYLVSLLDGARTLTEVTTIYNEAHPHDPRDILDVRLFVYHLAMGGLLNINARNFVEHARGLQENSKSWFSIWAHFISTMLFIKIPLLDPSPWLHKLVHAIRFVWSPWFACSVLAFFAWTAGLLYTHRSAFAENNINFFSASNIMLVWLTIIAIKTLHEFAHATTCRRFGGEVHEMGLCFMCFTPCGYVDASDSWMMRNKNHKIYTAVAGVFTELTIASVSAHLWLILPDSLWRNLAFNAMIVSSVNTLLFNLNPLMKFDGYYVFSDWMEIPNLRTKAIAYCSSALQRLLLGIRNTAQERMFADEKNARIFVFYAIFAYLYMFYIIYGFSIIFARLLKPYGLSNLGLIVGVFVEGSYAALPVIKVLFDAFSTHDHIEHSEPVWRRVSKVVAVLSIVFLAIAYFPTHNVVKQQAVAVSSGGEQVAAGVRGRIVEILVKGGDQVKAGQVLARMENRDLMVKAREAEADFALAKLAMDNSSTATRRGTSDATPAAAMQLEGADTYMQRVNQAISKLDLHAKADGTVLSHDLERFKGRYVDVHQTIMRIGDPNRLKLIVPLTEEQAEMVSAGDTVKGIWYSGETFETTLANKPERRADANEYLPGMYAAYGGPVPMEMTDQHTVASNPHYAIYLAEIEIPHDEIHREGMRARVEIVGQKTTLGTEWWRAISTFVTKMHL